MGSEMCIRDSFITMLLARCGSHFLSRAIIGAAVILAVIVLAVASRVGSAMKNAKCLKRPSAAVSSSDERQVAPCLKVAPNLSVERVSNGDRKLQRVRALREGDVDVLEKVKAWQKCHGGEGPKRIATEGVERALAKRLSYIPDCVAKADATWLHFLESYLQFIENVLSLIHI